MDKIEPKYLQAVEHIKTAILQSQYSAVRLVNQEQLKLYLGIGRYISENSRSGLWGSGALDVISAQLKNDLPGLMGFGVSSLKNMRTFYEAWAMIIRQPQLANLDGFPMQEFFAVPFTHHLRILEKVKDRDERSARRAIRAFKDEYLLDFINVDELDVDDIEDVDEKVLEKEIVDNIRNFILRFGKDFLFVENQKVVEVKGHTFKIDLLFFNRELNALVAVELKRGTFKTSYLGQLNSYLTILDDYVRKSHENPSIGLVLCKSADKSIVEYLIKDYNKPMGVATYRTKEEMPERFRDALPDIDELKKLL